MHKYIIGSLAVVIALSVASSALANDDRGERGNERGQRQEARIRKTTLSVCKKDAKSTRNAAITLAVKTLRDARKTLKQVKKDAITAANGDQAKIDAAKTAYRTATTNATAAYKNALSSARTAYDAAIVACKAVRPVASASPTPTASVSPSPVPTSYSLVTVATHNTVGSCWAVVNGKVYNLTSWIGRHPGGSSAITGMCGKDASDAFNGKHGGQARPASELAGFQIGILQ